MNDSENLTVNALCFHRGKRTILDGINLSVAPGEIACLIGPNGSGKSTLLRIIAGALNSDSGAIYSGGHNLKGISARERARLLSYAPQDVPYAFAFTVAEFIGLSQTEETVVTGGNARINELLKQFDLEDLTHRSLLTLSGGERQRAATARAIAQPTPFLLLDEPTAHLDLRHQKLLSEILRRESAQQKRGVLVVLHDLNLASALADRLFLLHQGKIFADGSAAEVITADNIATVYSTPVTIVGENPEKPGVFLA